MQQTSQDTATVTVVIPCFNLGRYLEETVDSVLAQTRTDFEIVIVDDGSTDEQTRDLLDNLKKPKTRVVRTENRGLGAARNRGAAESSAPYLCFLDADDLLRPRFLEQTLGRLEANPEAAFCSCWLENFGCHEGTWQPERIDLPQLLAECTILTASPIRRQAFEAVGGFDELMPIAGYEDWELWIHLYSAGFSGVLQREVLFDYRRRPGSMSATCCSQEGHLTLLEYMVNKHPDCYQEHLSEILELKELEIGALLKHNDDAERQLGDWLEPEKRALLLEAERLERRAERHSDALDQATKLKQEIERLQQGIAHQAERAQSAEAALAAVHRRASDLEASLSWRLTAPLRFLGAGFTGGRSKSGRETERSE